MSQPMFHASLSFALSAMMLKAAGLAGELAFGAAILSALVDLDSLSPDPRFERCLHSRLSLPSPSPSSPRVVERTDRYGRRSRLALSSHLLQDVLHGEPLSSSLSSIPVSFYRPDLARAVDLCSLPLALFVILL